MSAAEDWGDKERVCVVIVIYISGIRFNEIDLSSDMCDAVVAGLRTTSVTAVV